MNDVEALAFTDQSGSELASPRATRRTAQLSRLLMSPPLTVRYVLVSGVLGVPGSIIQLTLLLHFYHVWVGGYGFIVLNALWLVNFEVGLMRNFLLHCAYTWRMAPSWRRLWHAHVAATGALVIDLAAFNLIVLATGIIPLAQVFGAGSGFGFNYAYNRVKTFSHTARVVTEGTS